MPRILRWLLDFWKICAALNYAEQLRTSACQSLRPHAGTVCTAVWLQVAFRGLLLAVDVFTYVG